MNGIEKIQAAVARIDTAKIANYLAENPKSKTLRRIIRYSQRILASSNEEEIGKLTIYTAYNLETIVSKTNYVKNEEEKQHWLELSQELFMNTQGPKK